MSTNPAEGGTQEIALRAERFFEVVAHVYLDMAEAGVAKLEAGVEAAIASVRREITAARNRDALAQIEAFSALIRDMEAEAAQLSAAGQAAVAAIVRAYLAEQARILRQKLGVPEAVAERAVLALHAEPAPGAEGGTHKRDGSRFVRVAGTTASTDASEAS